MDRRLGVVLGGAAILLLIIIIGFVALSGEDDNEDASNNNDSETDVSDEAEAPEASIDDDPVADITPSSPEYSLTVSYLNEHDADEDTADGSPPEGQKWIVIYATAINAAGYDATIDPRSIYVLDVDGQSYTADEPSALTDPALVGAVLGEGEAQDGLVRITLPVDAVPEVLAWCPVDPQPCPNPIYAELP